MAESANLSVAILAGGVATRLRPITETIPKILVEVAGEPFLSHQLRLLRSNGLTKVVLCLGHLGHMVVEKYGDGANWDMEIQYSFDGETLLGTGGALIRALPMLDRNFYVLYGDSYLLVDYQAVGRAFLASRQLGLMTVFKNREAWDASNVWFENGKIRDYSKTNKTPRMEHIDYGLSLFQAKAFDRHPPNTLIDLSTIQTDLVARQELVGYEMSARFYEIGSHAGLAELSHIMASCEFGHSPNKTPSL